MIKSNDNSGIKKIVELVSNLENVEISDIMKRSRKQPFVSIRHFCIYTAYQAGYTEHEIGCYFGYDTSTVFYARTITRERIELYTRFKKLWGMTKINLGIE